MSNPQPKPTRSLGRRLLLGILLGVVVYGVLVFLRGHDKVRGELAHFQWSTFAIALALSLGNYVIRFVKWEYYLHVLGIRGVPKGESFLVFLSGFVLTVTPGKVGEVFKSWVLAELRGVSIERSAPIVFAERITDLIGMIALITIGASVFPGGVLWALLGSAAVLGLLAFVGIPRVGEVVLRLLAKAPLRVGPFFARIGPKLDLALRGVRNLTTPRRLVLPTLLSLFGWALEGVGVFFLLRGFGAELDIQRSVFFYATATLAGALVPVPGGLGVTEKVLEESMVGLGGVASGTATAAMILARVATLWFAVLLGFVALGFLRLANPKLLRSDD
jgi:glycosyltransferase 2 family protein